MTKVPSIVTPCHGMPLLAITEVSPNSLHDLVAEIVCTADGCRNTWDADGMTSPWNKLPGEGDHD